MKKFIAKSNYNIVIKAESLMKAKKIYKKMIIESLFKEGETINEVELKECNHEND